jgi:hypothetical protein
LTKSDAKSGVLNRVIKNAESACRNLKLARTNRKYLRTINFSANKNGLFPERNARLEILKINENYLIGDDA